MKAGLRSLLSSLFLRQNKSSSATSSFMQCDQGSLLLCCLSADPSQDVRVWFWYWEGQNQTQNHPLGPIFVFLVHPLCSQSQSVLIHEVILSQYQTSYLAFIELCMVPVISFPQTVKVHLRGITALQHVILLPLTSPVNFAVSFCCFHKISVIQYICNYKTNVIYKISSSVLLFELTLL